MEQLGHCSFNVRMHYACTRYSRRAAAKAVRKGRIKWCKTCTHLQRLRKIHENKPPRCQSFSLWHTKRRDVIGRSYQTIRQSRCKFVYVSFYCKLSQVFVHHSILLFRRGRLKAHAHVIRVNSLGSVLSYDCQNSWQRRTATSCISHSSTNVRRPRPQQTLDMIHLWIWQNSVTETAMKTNRKLGLITRYRAVKRYAPCRRQFDDGISEATSGGCWPVDWGYIRVLQ